MNKYVFDKTTQAFIVKRKDQTPTKADVCHLCGCSLIEYDECCLNDCGNHYWRVEVDSFEKGETIEFMLTEDDGSGEPAWGKGIVRDAHNGIVEYYALTDAVADAIGDNSENLWFSNIEYVRKVVNE